MVLRPPWPSRRTELGAFRAAVAGAEDRTLWSQAQQCLGISMTPRRGRAVTSGPSRGGAPRAKMAQALSAEEFQRMQAQLLELRTENYRLSDELRKNGAELSGLRQRVQSLDRDLAKANKALSKSKKAQEVEALLGETRMLQGKLQSQEDDFRLQNSTLLRELAKLCAQIEGLEEENRRLQGGGGAGGAPRDPPRDPPEPPPDGAQGEGGAPPAPPDEPPPQKPQPEKEEGGGGDAPPGDPPETPAQAEVARLQEEVAKLTEELREQRESFLRLQEEKETLLQESRSEAEARGARWEAQAQELRAQSQRLQRQLHSATQAQEELRELSKARAQELQETQSLRDSLRSQLQVCSGEREELRQRLHEAEAAQERLRQLQEEQERQRGELEAELGQLRAALGEEQQLRELREAEGRALRQELKDVQDGQRILEKKGSAALKDLRRQLQLERRRGERLQERLQELLVPSRARSGLDELGLDGGSPGRGPGGDNSSVSSLGRDGSAPGSTKSGSGSPGGGSAGGVPGGGGLSPAEVAELFQRLAQSQQERWLLEEKVRHLEVSSASMAEDLCRKSAIIQSFVRDSRTEAAGPSGPPRRGTGAGPGEEGLREMNKKLQNLLEEQLTKNLHLAQDLESLSQELAQLRKEQAAPPGPP